MLALRVTLLGLIARLLARCLTYVTARLEPIAAPQAPDTAPADPRQPPPPDHWVELVRQHAPQLLEHDAAGNAGVIEYRADDAPPRPAAPIPARQRPAAHAKRPLRLEAVSAQNLDAQAVSTRANPETPAQPLEVSARTDEQIVNPPSYAPASDDAPLVMPPRRPVDAPVPAQPIRSVSAPPTPGDPVSSHYADLPFEQTRLRETNTSVPNPVDIPTIHTSAGRAVSPNQQRTGVPHAPLQTVMRLTSTPLPPSGESFPADRWAALPDLPADEPRDAVFERQRRERLKREQEGRAWSE